PATGPLGGGRVLVSAGGTREPLDAVRYVGNRSSGRMGFALADEAAARGAAVTVVAANVGLARNPRVTYVEVETAAQLQAACERAFAACDVLLMAAAAGCEVATNEVTIVTASGERHVPLSTKGEVAAAVLDEVAALRAGVAAR